MFWCNPLKIHRTATPFCYKILLLLGAVLTATVLALVMEEQLVMIWYCPIYCMLKTSVCFWAHRVGCSVSLSSLITQTLLSLNTCVVSRIQFDAKLIAISFEEMAELQQSLIGWWAVNFLDANAYHVPPLGTVQWAQKNDCYGQISMANTTCTVTMVMTLLVNLYKLFR